jgi:hypothetical protein
VPSSPHDMRRDVAAGILLQEMSCFHDDEWRRDMAEYITKMHFPGTRNRIPIGPWQEHRPLERLQPLERNRLTLPCPLPVGGEDTGEGDGGE